MTCVLESWRWACGVAELSRGRTLAHYTVCKLIYGKM